MRTTVSILIVVFTTHVLHAQPAKRINVDEFPAAVIDDVVVPVPSEVFVVLDKLGSPNWKSVMREDNSKPSEDRVQTALLLGTVIADGFIAVQAGDAEAVKNTGRTVLNLAGAIGVRKSVIARSNSIIAAADKREWPRVRRELDGALQDVRNAMIELQDEQLAQLVSLGGWLRGTEALTLIVSNDYSKDGAELLHQPGLLDYFDERLRNMSPRLRDNALTSEIQTQLATIRPLIDTKGEAGISSESVLRIRDITSHLVQSITSREG